MRHCWQSLLITDYDSPDKFTSLLSITYPYLYRLLKPQPCNCHFPKVRCEDFAVFL